MMSAAKEHAYLKWREFIEEPGKQSHFGDGGFDREFIRARREGTNWIRTLIRRYMGSNTEDTYPTLEKAGFEFSCVSVWIRVMGEADEINGTLYQHLWIEAACNWTVPSWFSDIVGRDDYFYSEPFAKMSHSWGAPDNPLNQSLFREVLSDFYPNTTFFWEDMGVIRKSKHEIWLQEESGTQNQQQEMVLALIKLRGH